MNILQHLQTIANVQTLSDMSILSNKCSRLFKDEVCEQVYDRVDSPVDIKKIYRQTGLKKTRLFISHWTGLFQQIDPGLEAFPMFCHGVW